MKFTSINQINKSFRRLLGLFLIILVFFIAIRPEPAGGSQAVVKLTLWTHQRHMADLTKELVKEFNETAGRQKRIQITMRILGDDAQSVFQTAQKNKEGPDLYASGFDTGYPDPIKAGARIWFDDLPGFQEWKDGWPSWYWMEGITTYQGHIFAIPAQVINSRLIYNRDLFRKSGCDPDHPPRSYSELRKIARKITTANRGKAFGFAYCGAESWPLEWMPSQWAEANGEPAYWDWKTGRWALQGYNCIFQLVLDLNRDGSLFPGAATLTNDALRAQFAEGRIGMFMGEFWDVGVLTDQFPAKCDWGVASIPTWDGNFHGKSRAMMISGSWCINGQSHCKLEAWEVVKWFSRYEIRAKMYERGKCIDPDPMVVAKFVKKHPQVRGFQEFAGSLNQDYLATYPALPGWGPPSENPCTILRRILTEGGDLPKELALLDQLWNHKLDEYYLKNPTVNRGWNIYPAFDRRTGNLGKSVVQVRKGASIQEPGASK